MKKTKLNIHEHRKEIQITKKDVRLYKGTSLKKQRVKMETVDLSIT